MFDGVNEFLCIYTTTAIWFTTHSYICVKKLGFITLYSSVNLSLNNFLFKWCILDLTRILGIDVRYNLIHLLVIHLNIHVI